MDEMTDGGKYVKAGDQAIYDSQGGEMKGIKPNVVVYHKDADGYCAAAIAMMAGVDGTYIPMAYGEESDTFALLDSKVYMLDYALQPFSRMLTLNKTCELHWIDHHKSAIKAAMEANFEASGSQLTATGLAACELTWLHLFPKKRIPDWVRLVGRYDVWDHTDIDTIPFHYGILSHKIDPGDDMYWWRHLCNSPKDAMNETLSEGKAVWNYIQRHYADLTESASFNLHFNGLRFIAINAMNTGSKIVDSVWDHGLYDAILTFGWAKTQWTVGLYTDKPGVDVSKIAVEYGGGGHKDAAGFQCDELPFGLPAINWMKMPQEREE